jgi:hypothetical protein
MTLARNTLIGTSLAFATLSLPLLAKPQAQPVLELSDAAAMQGPQALPLQQLGRSSFYVSIFHVYDAELWAPATGFSWDDPFRLKLTYARKIEADQLVNTSLKEMARIFDGDVDELEALRLPLKACFRDVKKGDVIEGVSESRDAAVFFFNGNETCRLELPEASYQFFSIWLNENSRSPKQTRRLLGQKRP